MTNAVVSDFRSAIAHRIEASHQLLASCWLEELKRVVPVADNDIFPGEELLGQIPALIQELAVSQGPGRRSHCGERGRDREGHRAWPASARSARLGPSGAARIPGTPYRDRAIHQGRESPSPVESECRRAP